MRKYFLNLLILFVIFNSVIVIVEAQLQGQSLIDSLLKELPKAKPDTNKVNKLQTISTLLKNINPDKGIEYGEQAEVLSKKLNWNKGIANSYKTIANNYIRKFNNQKALLYFEMALNINKMIGNKQEISLNLADIGTVYFLENEYPKALKFYNNALEISQKIGQDQNSAAFLILIGNTFLKQSNYVKSLDCYHKSLRINEKRDHKIGTAICLINIGEVYVEQSEYNKALDYYYRSLKIFEDNQLQQGIGITLTNIGKVYLKKKDYSTALQNFLSSLDIMEKKRIKYGIALNLGYIGEVHYNFSNFIKSLELYESALKINQEINDKSGIASNYGAIGELYLKLTNDSIIESNKNLKKLFLNRQNIIDKAINNLLKAIDISKSIGDLHNQSNYLKSLSDAYYENNEIKNSFIKFKEYKTLQDSLFSLVKSKEIANLESTKELEVKEKENLLLLKDKERQNAVIKVKNLQRNFFIAGAVVFIILFLIAFVRFREKKKLSDKLSIQNAEIENQKRLVEAQKSLVEEKNTQIIDSINYASTIQNALLPWDSVLNKSFKEHFVIYKPKDIVSGDSYWFQEVGGIKYLAVIDCTGHGVPGSMLTVIANSVLDDAVLSKKLTSTADILTHMNDKVTDVLNQRHAENSIRDGMEVCLIAIKKEIIQFTGAGRPLCLKNGRFETIKTDKRGIAGQSENDDYQFSSVEIEMNENMTLYLTSDGFADQMNEQSKKYSTKRFIETLEKISELPLEKQKEMLENELNSHKGNREQIDDVTVIGVRL